MLVLMCYDNKMVENSDYIHVYTNKLTKSGMKKFGARSCHAPNIDWRGTKYCAPTLFWSLYSTPSSRLYGHKQN